MGNKTRAANRAYKANNYSKALAEMEKRLELNLSQNKLLIWNKFSEIYAKAQNIPNFQKPCLVVLHNMGVVPGDFAFFEMFASDEVKEIWEDTRFNGIPVVICPIDLSKESEESLSKRQNNFPFVLYKCFCQVPNLRTVNLTE